MLLEADIDNLPHPHCYPGRRRKISSFETDTGLRVKEDWFSYVESLVHGAAKGKPTFLFFTSYEKTIFSLDHCGEIEATNLTSLDYQSPPTNLLPRHVVPVPPSVVLPPSLFDPVEDEWL